jgi:ATP-dependent helicase/nuclease subunit A
MSTLTDFQKAALDHKKHISLTANAGSGKTTVLTKRYVEILTKENISINNVVAITFTEKAASELYSKIALELDRKILETEISKRHKLEAIRRSLVSAKISTIHSFCIDILKDFAPEAGIDANFSPIDSRIAEELLDRSIDEIITSNLFNNSDHIKKLIRIFGSKSQLIKKIKELFNKRKTTEQLEENLYNNDIEEVIKYFHNKFEEQFGQIFKIKIDELINNIEKVNAPEGSAKLSEKQIEINRILIELETKSSLTEKFILLNDIRKTILTQSGTILKRGYLTKEAYENKSSIIDEINNTFSEFKDIVIDCNYENLNKDLAIFGKDIINFYKEINECYTNKKNQKSFLDFEDLLLLTQKLLKKTEVKESLSEKFKYIMIDEYQDTNDTQYNIFMPILKNLSAGNLFVVGDEKQSIYMFREAEVELFNQTKKEIETKETKGSILDLPHSFRLAPNIALFTNKLFRKLFAEPNPIFNEVDHNDLICAYQNDLTGKVEFLISNEGEISEAEIIARKIIKVKEGNKDYSFGSFSILCTKRKNFAELEKVFSDYNIPFSIVGGKGFFQQQLVLDISNYISFLINPKNDLALASILRAPYFGLTDTELTKISLQKGSFLFSKLKCLQKYNNIIEILNKHIKLSKSLRTSELIRLINVETGYWSYIAFKPNGKQEIANMEKLIIKSIQISEQGFNTLYDFNNYLSDAINQLEDEGQADLDETENSVKIMTVHQAKGLEFKVVILYKTNQKIFDERLKAKEIAVDKNYGILTKLPESNNFFEDYKQAPIVGLYNYVQKKKSLAEEKRLLYVAITRAEEHLIVSASIKKEKFQNDSFAAMIFDSFNLDTNDKILSLEDELTFMKNKNDKYTLSSQKVSFDITIENMIESAESRTKINENEINKNYNIYISAIPSHEKNEIISASKISLFLNCPRKYELTYEFGYGELTKLFRVESDFEFSLKEEDSEISGNLIGSILHSILEKNIPINQIEDSIRRLLNKEEETLHYSELQIHNSIDEIKNIVNEFYKSNSYTKLNSFKKYFNEIEFYKREYDYYLYGIIDKLIVLDDKIIIVDYKSDKISRETIEEKNSTYINQLKFYAYLLANKYPSIDTFELRLVFLRDDDFSRTETISRIEVEEFGKVIQSSVKKIRIKDFSAKTDGCNNMKYYLLEN